MASSEFDKGCSRLQCGAINFLLAALDLVWMVDGPPLSVVVVVSISITESRVESSDWAEADSIGMADGSCCLVGWHCWQ